MTQPYCPPTPEALAVVDEYDLSQEQILAALHCAPGAKHGDEWDPVLIDDLMQGLSDPAWDTAKASGWYALEAENCGRELWRVTEKGKAVLAPFIAQVTPH